MRGTWKLVVAAAAVGMLLTLAGCGSSGDEKAEANAPAAGGASGQAGGGSVKSGPTAASAGPMGVLPAGGSLVPERLAVEIDTSLGKITIELDDENAPATVDNFLAYVERGFYDQTIFHQVFPGAVILGGMFTGNFTPKQPDPPVNNEAHNGLKNRRGTIAMFRDYDVINSGTCQFFINVKDNPNYDYKPGARETLTNPQDYGYCVFGRVSEQSMDVVDRIADVEVHDQGDFERTPVQTVQIRSIRMIR